MGTDGSRATKTCEDTDRCGGAHKHRGTDRSWGRGRCRVTDSQGDAGPQIDTERREGTDINRGKEIRDIIGYRGMETNTVKLSEAEAHIELGAHTKSRECMHRDRNSLSLVFPDERETGQMGRKMETDRQRRRNDRNEKLHCT